MSSYAIFTTGYEQHARRTVLKSKGKERERRKMENVRERTWEKCKGAGTEEKEKRERRPESESKNHKPRDLEGRKMRESPVVMWTGQKR
jgi:hypothetical protein